MEKRKVIRKICLLGDGGVGKTSLIDRFVLNSFSEDYIISFGTRVSKKVIEYEEVQLTLMIWDVLGQKTQKTLHGAYYNGANGVLLVCDNTREETLLNLPTWKSDLEVVTGTVPVIPVVNKSDLPTSISPENLTDVREAMGHDFLFTSAKTGQGVQEAFENIGRRVLGVAH
ncbi:MAG: GTP-binding protein [Methanomassiliicoccus sp.]|nr:GTP-binding protein [Methanomassiliicoccus sp.]